jgi:hypothetical protein
MHLVVTDELQRETHARDVLHANDLGVQVQRVFAGEIELDLELGAFVDDAWHTHEQAVARDIFDEPVDHDAVRPALHPNTDRDSYSCPLIHVVKATLTTYLRKINSLPDASL